MNSDIIDIFISEYSKEFSEHVGRKLRAVFKQSEALNWNFMCRQLDNMKMDKGHLIKFYEYLLKKGISLGENSTYLRENKWIFDLTNLEKNIFREKFFFIGSDPRKIYLCSNEKNRKAFYIDIDNVNLRNIIINYLEERAKQVKLVEYVVQNFINIFEESLKNCSVYPKKYEDFSYNTFKIQYEFYKNIICKYKNSDKAKFELRELIFFYISLINKLEAVGSNYKIFDEESGIDKNYLLRIDFYKFYDSGYKVVNLNKLEAVPKHDKWLINPNGYENNTTAIKADEYMPLNFSRVKDDNMRSEIKEWIYYSNRSLKSLRNEVNALFIFFEFIEGEEIDEYRKKLLNIAEINDNKKYNNLLSENNIIL